jgi:hypothetical protein
MTGYAAFGPPGVGKDMYCAEKARKRDRREFPGLFADYQLHGSVPILSIPDMLQKPFASSYWLLGEVGARLSARGWEDADKAEFVSFTQHRKGNLQIYASMQHPNQIDKQVRQTFEFFIRLVRVGPRGDEVIKLGHRPRGLRGLFMRPWWFVARWYHREQLTADLDLREGLEPIKRERFKWTWETASSYNSAEQVIPEELLERFKDQAEGAELRAIFATMEVRNGRAVPVYVVDNLGLKVPRVMRGKASAGAGAEPLTLEDPRLRLFLRMKGIYVESEKGSDGQPLVDVFGNPLQLALSAPGISEIDDREEQALLEGSHDAMVGELVGV